MDVKRITEKITLPMAIIIAAVILGVTFYAVQYNEQQSIERQQVLKIKQDCREKYPGTGLEVSLNYSKCISIIE